MLKTGLVTISFRSLTPKKILSLAVETGLETLEWGGDVHVPPNDLNHARMVAQWTEQAGLTTAAYGSYYRLGTSSDPEKEFRAVVETASILKAPIIRIWGGGKGSADLTPSEWEALVAEGRLITAMAAEKGITLSLECHHGTLTDDYRSSLRYLKEVPGMTMYWQPNQFLSEEENKKAASALASVTTNIHVFHWDAAHRYPLSQGESIWQEYLVPFTGKDHALLLEFMHDDAPSSLQEAADTLRRILQTVTD